MLSLDYLIQYILPTVLFIAFLWYAFVIVYHFIRFGIGIPPKVFALVFFIGAFTLFSYATSAYGKIDWQAMFDFIRNSLPTG